MQFLVSRVFNNTDFADFVAPRELSQPRPLPYSSRLGCKPLLVHHNEEGKFDA